MELDEKYVNVVEQRGRLLAQVVEHVPFATLAIYFEHADPAAGVAQPFAYGSQRIE